MPKISLMLKKIINLRENEHAALMDNQFIFQGLEKSKDKKG